MKRIELTDYNVRAAKRNNLAKILVPDNGQTKEHPEQGEIILGKEPFGTQYGGFGLHSLFYIVGDKKEYLLDFAWSPEFLKGQELKCCENYPAEIMPIEMSRFAFEVESVKPTRLTDLDNNDVKNTGFIGTWEQFFKHNIEKYPEIKDKSSQRGWIYNIAQTDMPREAISYEVEDELREKFNVRIAE